MSAGSPLLMDPADTPQISLYEVYTLALVPGGDPADSLCILHEKLLISSGMDPADTPKISINEVYTPALVPGIDPADTLCNLYEKFLISPGMDPADTQLTPLKSP